MPNDPIEALNSNADEIERKLAEPVIPRWMTRALVTLGTLLAVGSIVVIGFLMWRVSDLAHTAEAQRTVIEGLHGQLLDEGVQPMYDIPEDGVDGIAGLDGSNGAQGPQGVPGESGAPGKDGAAGTNGTNGSNGADGLNGANGSDGSAGTNGSDGTPGRDGTNGADGRGITAIECDPATGTWRVTFTDGTVTHPLGVCSTPATSPAVPEPTEGDTE